MSAYPAGYIEGLARPFKIRVRAGEERARRQRSQGELHAPRQPCDERGHTRALADTDTQSLRR